MNVRTLSLAAAAAAGALLLPALQTGAAAEPPGQSKKPAASPSPSAAPEAACSVAVDPTRSVGEARGPVLQSAELANNFPENPENAGYYVAEQEYPGSSTFRATISYTPPSTGGCGSISLLTFPYVVVDGRNVFLPGVQSRTVPLSGTGTSVAVDSLVVGLPANSKQNDNGLCVGSQIEVRDAEGTVVQRFPEAGPLDFCPVPGGRTYV